MKITLIQSEIEDAIRQYVDKVISVQEGTSVSIELFSPRGSQDINATVNLVTPAEQKAAYKSKAPEEVTQRPTRTGSETPVASKPAAVADQQPQAGASTDQQAPAANVDEGNGADTQTTSDAQEPAPTPAKSLFGNLARPKN